MSIFRITAIISLILLSLLGASTLQYLYHLGVLSLSKSDINPILEWQPVDNTIIYDRNHEKIGEVFSSHHIYVPFANIPEGMVNAITAIEDRKFWHHQGYDLKAMIRAALAYLKGGGGRYRQGASTITQQVVRHFLLTREKSINRKIKEIFLAHYLEQNLSKEKIFEIYANALFLGAGSYGVGSAAHRYFGKELENLGDHEFALISGLFQSPSRYNPHRYPKRAKKRQKSVLKAMIKVGFISGSQAKQLYKTPLEYKPYKSLYGRFAPYFKDYVQQSAKQLLNSKNIKNQGLRIYTTLNPELQKLAENAIANASENLEKAKIKAQPVVQKNGTFYKPKIEASILVTDPTSGEVLAMVGGRDYSHSKFNRTTQALRQPGSSFKPIVFSLALQEGYKWSDMLYVSPITLSGNYRPRNPESDYMTETTLIRAFYRSMNSPTMELGEKIGINKILNHAKQLGIQTPIKKEFGSILGSSATTMLDLARVYGVFANQGRKNNLTAITMIKNKNGDILFENKPQKNLGEQVLNRKINFLLVQAMRNVLMHGTGHSARSLAYAAAGKTGTSNQSKDNWFCGFSKDLVAIVWVGTDEFTGLGANSHGSTLSLPIWKDFMASSFELKKPKRFTPPGGVTSMNIHPNYGYPNNQGIKVWFINGMTPSKRRVDSKQYEKMTHFRDPFARKSYE